MIGQGPAPAKTGTAKGAVVGTGVFTAFVDNMDRSLGFYHDVFGMEVPPLPASGTRPYNNPNPRLFQFFDIPGAKERHQSARVPGLRTSPELMEIQDVDHKTIPLRIQDPGTATVVFVVRDIDALVSAVKSAGLTVVSEGGVAVPIPPNFKGALVADPNNFFVTLFEPCDGCAPR